MLQTNNYPNKIYINAFTLVETVVSMTLVSVIFIILMHSFSSILLGSFLVDSRTSVRNESEFAAEYFESRIKNADSRIISCNNDANNFKNGQHTKSIKWQNNGDTTQFLFKYYANPNNPLDKKFCLNSKGDNDPIDINLASRCDNILTYNDVIVEDVEISCSYAIDEVSRVKYFIINLSYNMSSVAKMGDRPAVYKIPRHISIAIK